MDRLVVYNGDGEAATEDALGVAATSARDLLLLFETIATVAIRGAKEERYSLIGADIARDLAEQLEDLAGLSAPENGPRLVTNLRRGR